jgi:hypothetical protein
MRGEQTIVEGAWLGAHYEMSFSNYMAHAFCRVTRQQGWVLALWADEGGSCIYV